MKAAIVVDDWKLPTFYRYLKAAGYSWEHKGAFTPGASILHVETTSREALQQVLEQATAECRNQGTRQ